MNVWLLSGPARCGIVAAYLLTGVGIENGDLNSPATGKDGVRNAYHGRGLAILQSTCEPGKVLMINAPQVFITLSP